MQNTPYFLSWKTTLLRGICVLVCFSLLCSPAYAQNIEADTQFAEADSGSAEPVETNPQETVPQETAPQETAPQDAAAQETVPQETVSAETECSQEPSAPPAVPLYFQTDYPNHRYGAGTIASSGCGITCLAMVASALTGYDYLPDELADYFGGQATNNIERLEIGSTTLQLPWRKAENVRETFAALAEGDIAIVLMNSNSIFSDSQHFLVLTGLNSEGRIMVNDPYQPNYEYWLLKNGFANGFEEGDLIAGYSGSWIYDVSAMPENPIRYTEPEPTEPSRYPGITLTAEEEELLARLIYLEAAGEPAEGQQAIAEVIFNRMVSDAFPNTLKGVLFAEGQFPPAARLEQAEPYQAQYDAIADALSGPNILPMDVVHYATFAVTDLVWGTIGGHIFCYGV